VRVNGLQPHKRVSDGMMTQKNNNLTKSALEIKKFRRTDTTKSNKSDEILSISSTASVNKSTWRDFFNPKELAKALTFATNP